MLGLNRLSIQTKMILLLLAVSLSSIAVVAWNSYKSGREALIRAAEDHLKGVQVAKTTTLKAMLDSLRDQVISMSDSHVIIDGMKDFRAAYKSLNAASLTAEQVEKLEGFYENDFLPKLAEQIDGEPVLEQYLPVKPAERYLQYHYLSNNPHPYGMKQELEESESDQSAYAKVHETYHKAFERAVKIFGFEDVMLVDADSMEIVYSYQKTSEFATNLETGPYANTLMASKVRTMRGNNDRDDFKIADFDWVIAEGVMGRVIEINWRSVHIETPTRELQIIPNVSLYKGPFTNLSRPTTARTERIEVGFSYDDPPNRVKSLMMGILTTTDGVIQQPPPSVRTFNYADFSIIYRLSFTVESMEDLPDIRDSIMTRIWYVVKREGLTIPFPIAFEYGPGESPTPTPPTPAQLLGRYPRFKLALKHEESEPVVKVYAAGETVQDAEVKFKGFALILEGRAKLLSADANGKAIQIGEIGAGECFGDQLTAGASVSDIVAIEDLKIMVFEDDVIGDLLNQSPVLADEIGDAIELRRQAVQSARKVRGEGI